MVRPTATSTTSLLLAALLRGAAGRGDPSCPPRVVVDPGVPTRLAERLRARLAALPQAEARCGELLFRWDRSRLVIEVALQDGRIARRTLRSLEDALPTALAVLATPPREDEAPAVPDAPSEPAPAPTPTPPVVPATPPAAVAPAAVAPASALRLRVEGGIGGGWAHGRGLFAQRAEVALVWRRAILAVNGQWRSSDGGSDGSDVRGQRYGLALRWRFPLEGRWALELGGIVAAGALRLVGDDRNTGAQRMVWSLDAGVDAGASLRLTQALFAVARAEVMATMAHFDDDPDGVYGASPISLSLTLGLRLEVAP